jgi:hypothetical protein
MSAVDQALIVNGAVLFAVLEADLGPHRKITWFRILRPVLIAGAIIPLYLTALATHGSGLYLELAGTVAGVLLGLLTITLMRVYRSPRTGRPVSRAGFGYAALWIVIIGARSAFSYGAAHWFGPQLATWMIAHQVTTGAITDALILMAVAIMATRTASLAVRARTLPSAGAPQHAGTPDHADASR